mgnify:CR=1 FL=1
MKNLQYLTAYLMALSLCMFVSCKGTEYAENIVEGYDKLVNHNGEGIVGIQYEIIPLSEKGEGILTYPSKVAMNDYAIYIMDDNKVLSYDFKGNFRAQIGRFGHGDKEYINASTFYIDSDSKIVLYDSYKNVLLRYSKQGKVIDERKVSGGVMTNAQTILPVNENRLFVYNYIYNKNNRLCSIVDLENEDEEVVSSTPVSSENAKEYVGHNPCSQYNGIIRYLRPFDQHIYTLWGDTALVVDTKEKLMTETELAQIKNYSIVTYADCMNNGGFTGFTDIYETSRYLILSCHNIAYTIIDKKTLTCKRYKYKVGENIDASPLCNILGVHNNTLIGLLPKEKVEEIIKTSKSRLSTALQKSMNNQQAEHYVVLFDMTDCGL